MARSNAAANVPYPKHPIKYLPEGVNPPCSEVGPDPFFPEPGGDSNKVAAQARAICNSGCPVKNECFTYAIGVNVDGIWAGTNQRERASYRMTHDIIAHDMSMEEFAVPPVVRLGLTADELAESRSRVHATRAFTGHATPDTHPWSYDNQEDYELAWRLP